MTASATSSPMAAATRYAAPAVRAARSVARPAASPATAEVVAVVRKIASQAVMFSAAAAIASESSGARPR